MWITDRLLAEIDRAEFFDISLRSISVNSGVPYPVLYRFAKRQRGLNLKTADTLWAYFFSPEAGATAYLESVVHDLIIERIPRENRNRKTFKDLKTKLVDSILALVEKETSAEAGKIKDEK